VYSSSGPKISQCNSVRTEPHVVSAGVGMPSRPGDCRVEMLGRDGNQSFWNNRCDRLKRLSAPVEGCGTIFRLLELKGSLLEVPPQTPIKRIIDPLEVGAVVVKIGPPGPHDGRLGMIVFTDKGPFGLRSRRLLTGGVALVGCIEAGIYFDAVAIVKDRECVT